MIKENQSLLNQLNVASDALLVLLALPIAFWLRFSVLPDGIITVGFHEYVPLNMVLMGSHLLFYAFFGLYSSQRKARLLKELLLIVVIGLVNMGGVLSFLFLSHEIHYSRGVLAIYFLLSTGSVCAKRVALRLTLRHFRSKGYNLKHVIIVGSGEMARSYYRTVRDQRQLGYHPMGYVANEPFIDKEGMEELELLGSYNELEKILEEYGPDEVVAAIDIGDYYRTPQVIDACEKTGTKLSIIPLYAEYMTSHPQFDAIGSIPLLNIRRIPLDNFGNAFLKRAMDIVCSAILLLVTSPIMLVCAVGVRLSSPGPIIFKQERVGLNKKPYDMYKFRSMRVNSDQSTGWSTDRDDRKTRFGSILRKYSLDEFPQFFNVLMGDMSLVGPRPELPHHVNHFKDEIPLYMVKHQVRPGITGWAQVNGFRGDTSIKARIEHDIYYIENWSLLFDIQILLMTVFKGKFVNSEKLN